MAKHTIGDPGKTYTPQPRVGGHQTAHRRRGAHTWEESEPGVWKVDVGVLTGWGSLWSPHEDVIAVFE